MLLLSTGIPLSIAILLAPPSISEPLAEPTPGTETSQQSDPPAETETETETETAPGADVEDDAPPPIEVDPTPEVREYDSPQLEKQSRYPTPVSSYDPSVQRRERRRALGSGLFLGIGTTLAIAAPIVVLRPTKPLLVDLGDGSSIGIETNGAPIAAGFFVGILGGVSNLVGGRLLSNLDVEPRRALRRQKGLNIASGVAFGVAGGLFTAAVIDGSRAGTQWQEILGREFGPEDIPDAEEATSKGSRAIAMLSAVPSMIGLGIGLRLGANATASVVPTTSGLAVVGRF